MGMNVGYLTSDIENDEVFSPYYVVDHILKYLPIDKVIWTPFDLEWSAFYQRLKEKGYKVVRSHIRERQNFFYYEPDEWDIIVSNPPFSEKDRVLRRLYSFNKPFAILLPLNALQGAARYEFFRQGIQLLTFNTRVCYHDSKHLMSTANSCPFATAYFCRDLVPKDLIIELLVEYQRPLLEYTQDGKLQMPVRQSL